MNKIIKASAGTGKTYRITLEYICSLILGEEFSSILVMTFTKKATAEIRDRIFKFLEEIIYNKENALDIKLNIEKLLGFKPKNYVELEKIYLEMKRNKSKIKIYTIDGFLSQIFSNLVIPEKRLFTYSFDQDTNMEIYDKVLERIASSKKFDELKSFFSLNVSRDITEYSSIVKLIISNRWKYLLTKKIKKTCKREEIQIGITEIFEDILNMLREIINAKGKNSETDLYSFLKSEYKEYLNIRGELEKEKFIVSKWEKILIENSYFHNGNKTKGKDYTEEVNHIKEITDYLKKIIAKKVYENEMINFEKEYLKISEIIYEVYDRLKFSEKSFSHSDITNYIFEYFQNNIEINKNGINVKFLEKLGFNFNTIFIDEFQDTSFIQWQILKYFVKYAGNVIIVGDSKQAIYGWRNGEKDLFENLENIENFKDFNVENLDITYRSDQNIIKFINEGFFEIENFKYNETIAKSMEDGYVNINYLEKKEKNNEYGDYFELIEAIKENNDYENSAIIARTKKQLLEIGDLLATNNIPYTIESSGNILDLEPIDLLVKIFEYVCYNDFYSLLIILRSKLFNISLEDLKIVIIEKTNIENRAELSENVPQIIVEKINKIYQICDLEYTKSLQYIINEFDFLQIFNTNNEIENIYKFLDLLYGFSSYQNIIMWIRENKSNELLKCEKIINEKAITLLTIHKSKGLEFNSVYFYSGIISEIGGKKPPKFLVDYDKNFNNITKYYIFEGKYEKVLNYIDNDFLKKQNLKKSGEILNNLYVAVTRSKHNLYYFAKYGSQKERIKDIPLQNIFKNKLVDIENFNIVEYGKQYYKIKEELIENIPNAFEKNIKNEVTIFKIENKKNLNQINNIVTEIKRKEGLALHYFFEFINSGSINEIKFSSSQIYKKYGNMLGDKKIINIIARAIGHIKKNKTIFNESIVNFNEVDIVDEELNIYRIDRINYDNINNKITVIDYKDSKNAEDNKKYILQVENYKKILQIKYPNYNIECVISEIL